MTPDSKIYFDYAATTPLDAAVQKAMQPYFSRVFGNPSSLHWAGQEAEAAVIKARRQVADFFGCLPQEIIFTSGATESDNLALKGVIKNCQWKNPKQKLHLITSAIEHHAIIDSCRSLEKQGVQVTYLPVTKDGCVSVSASQDLSSPTYACLNFASQNFGGHASPSQREGEEKKDIPYQRRGRKKEGEERVQLGDLEKAIRPETVLVSIMYANNEIGTIQPIAEISKLLKEINQQRLTQKLPRIVFHTDAVQAVNYLDCDVAKLGVDMLSLSGHKIYGPKGIGALFVKKGTPISRIQDGGAQEYDLRAGTHNVPGIVGLAAAINSIKKQVSRSKYQEASIKYLRGLRERLIDGVLKIPGSQLNGSREKRLPNNANFSFWGVEGESLMIALDQAGIAVSTGSACASRSLEPSHVLLALGCSHELAHSSLRVSLGKYTTEKEVDYFLEVLPKIIARLRKISGRA